MLGTRWPGGVSPPIVQDSIHLPGNLSGETPPSQPARRQRSGRNLHFNPGRISSTSFSKRIEIPFVTMICLR